MKSRWLLNAALLALLVALGAVVWLKPGTEPQPSQPAIVDLKPDAVQRIAIEQPGRPMAELERRGGHWQMLKPVKAPADDGVIGNFLADINEKSQRHYSVDGLDLKQFGLKPAKLKLTLNDQQLAFGDSAPLNYLRYIRHGDRVYLVNDSLYYRLSGDPLSLVSKRLLPRGARIVSLKLPGQTISRDGKNGWQLTPPQPHVTTDRIQKLVDRWESAEAFNVRAAEQASAAGEVEIRLAGSDRPLVFRILKNDSVLALAREDLGVDYQLAANERDKLLKLAGKTKKKAANATGK